MANIISEGLECIGRIDNDGFVFDTSGNNLAKITDSGYICQLGSGKIFGRIEEDGTIRDSSGDVAGRIQADGYVYIRGKRVCQVSSSFIESITPGAWNAGETSTYAGRAKTTHREPSYSDYSESGEADFGIAMFVIKLVIGIGFGIFIMIKGGGIGSLLVCPAFVFLVSFLLKVFFPRD